MLKIRRPLGRLIFNMGIAIPGKTVFLIETAPRCFGKTFSALYGLKWGEIGPVRRPVVIGGTATLVLYLVVTGSLQHIGRSDTRRWNLRVSDLPELQRLALNKGQQDSSSSNNHQVDMPYCVRVTGRYPHTSHCSPWCINVRARGYDIQKIEESRLDKYVWL